MVKKKSNLIFELIKKPDLFGRRVNLLYNEKDYFRTYCGSFGTMVLIIGVSIVAYFNFLKLINYNVHKLEYFETNKNHEKKLFQNIKFSSEYIRFALVLEKEVIPLIEIEFLDRDLNENSSNFKGVNCDMFKFQDEESYLKVQGLTKKCFEVRTENVERNPLSFVVKKCAQKNCTEILEKKFSKIKLFMFIEVSNDDITTEEDIRQFKKIELSLNIKFEKKISVDLIEIQSTTFNSPFKFDLLTRDLVLRSSNEQIIDFSPQKNLLLLELKILPDTKLVIKKTIFQFYHFLSLIGGLMKGTTFFIFIFVWPFREILYYRKLVNEMFVLCDDQKTLKNVVEKIHAVGLNNSQNQAFLFLKLAKMKKTI